jgi:hypothetical protein
VPPNFLSLTGCREHIKVEKHWSMAYATIYDLQRPKYLAVNLQYTTFFYRITYSKYTIYDMSYMRLYATSRSLSWQNGRVAGVYFCMINQMLNSILSKMSYNVQYKFVPKHLKYAAAVMKLVQYQSCYRQRDPILCFIPVS